MKKLFSLLWLLLIPLQLAVGFLFIRFGALIDMKIFSGSTTGGHGMPIFSLLFLIIAIIAAVAVSVTAVVLTIKGFIKNKK